MSTTHQDLARQGSDDRNGDADAGPGASEHLARLVAAALPGARLTSVSPLSPDAHVRGGTAKAVGYGEPLRLVARHQVAWRALVIGNPIFYPRLAPATRDRLLGLAERALAADAFDPDWADEVAG